ncbi:MAG: hypothetical protein GY859_40265 [Desulfobacterales bacterium]|nr:hypothetical protein [Desulfobacterales bacterium]
MDYIINSKGMRDDQASLIAPEIIVAGDSIAMGWGVRQDKTFGALLEKKSGKSVLNAAISSYGTVREMRILERVNLNNLKYLIIQYCDNDFRENRTYKKNGNRLPVISKRGYNWIRQEHKNATFYFFGKHTYYR